MAVSYSDIRKVADTKQRLIKRAQEDLHTQLASKAPRDIYDATMNVLSTYGNASQEIGAQWYDMSAEKSSVRVPAATIDELDLMRYSDTVEDIIADYELGLIGDDELEHALDELLGESLTNISRGVVFDNMRRDDVFDWRVSDRDRRVRYARVPVGETCAWCIMLASLGPWYLSEESAGAYDPDRFHSHCDCEVIPYTDMEDIDGYADTLGAYRDMYYDARFAWENGDVSDALKDRIDKAHEEHDKKYEAGEVSRKWDETNEILITMRDFYGLH